MKALTKANPALTRKIIREINQATNEVTDTQFKLPQSRAAEVSMILEGLANLFPIEGAPLNRATALRLIDDHYQTFIVLIALELISRLRAEHCINEVNDPRSEKHPNEGEWLKLMFAQIPHLVWVMTEEIIKPHDSSPGTA